MRRSLLWRRLCYCQKVPLDGTAPSVRASEVFRKVEVSINLKIIFRRLQPVAHRCRRTWVDYAQNAASLGRASPNRLDFEQAVDANLAVAYTSELTEAGRRMTYQDELSQLRIVKSNTSCFKDFAR